MPRPYATLPDGDPLQPLEPSPTRAQNDRAVVVSKLTERGVSLDPDEWAEGVKQVPRDYARFPFVVVDLFAGAGGSSTGIMRALEKMRVPTLLIMINHWSVAIQTQIINFPEAIHLNASVETPDPVAIIPWKHIDLLVGSPECFGAGTLVVTDRGLIAIEDVAVGDKVLTHMRRWKTVTSTYASEDVRPLMSLRGHGFDDLRVTADHPLFARTRRHVWNNERRDYDARYDEPQWLAAGEARDAYTMTPRSMPALAIPSIGSRSFTFSEDFWWMVGRWVGDGSVRLRDSNSEITICCGKHEADALAERLNRFAPATSAGRARGNELRWRRRDVRTATLFETGHDSLANWLVSNFGRLAHGKTIPTWALGMPREHRQALLEGYLSADGHLEVRKHPVQTCTTVSKRLAIGIRLLAESLGHRVSLRRRPPVNDVIEGRRVKARDLYHLSWYPEQHRASEPDSDVESWHRVKLLRAHDQQERVYCIDVEDDHSFIADGIAVHNCITFSPARGKRKIREQSRSSAAFLLTWLERVNVQRFAFENVKEWRTWGRLNKEGTATLKGYEGEYYRGFFRRLKSLGYKRAIDAVLNSANYGSPTSRLRLFIIGEKSSRPLKMPEPTHTQYPEKYPNRKPWRTAREIINFADKGHSSFARYSRDGSPDGPHAVASLRRTRAGYERQISERPGAAAYARAFDLFIPIAQEFHDNQPPTLKSLQNAKAAVADAWRARYGYETRDRKLSPAECNRILLDSANEWRQGYAIVTTAGLLSDADRKLIKIANVARSRERTADVFREPIMHFEEVQTPDGFTLADRTHSAARPLDQPVHALTSATGGGIFVAQPTIMGQQAGSIARSVDESPVMTIAKGGAIGLSQPYLTRANASETSSYDDATRDCDRPMGSLVAKSCIGLVQPTLSGVSHGSDDARTHEIEAPLQTITEKRAIGLNQPDVEIADPALIEVAHGDHPNVQRRSADINSPLGALHASGGKYGIADPQLSTLYSGYDRGPGAAHHSIEAPTPPITAGGGHIAVVQPDLEPDGFILSRHSAPPGRETDDRSHSLDGTVPTVMPNGGGYLVNPTLVPQHSAARLRDPNSETVPTIVGIARIGLTQGAGPEPFIYEPHGERDTQRERVHDVDKPTLTVTPRGAGTLVQAEAKAPTCTIRDVEYKPKITINGKVFVLDSYFRMLRNIELARAMDLIDENRGYSFSFAGSETEVTRQIGNAVASNVMEALTSTLCENVVGLPHDTDMIEVFLAPIPIENTFGIYKERVIRHETRDDGSEPVWFTPRETPLHVGIHEPGGRHTFIELAGNDIARMAQHPYEVEIVENSDQATALELFPLAA